jgi:hypothetical protein
VSKTGGAGASAEGGAAAAAAAGPNGDQHVEFDKGHGGQGGAVARGHPRAIPGAPVGAAAALRGHGVLRAARSGLSHSVSPHTRC